MEHIVSESNDEMINAFDFGLPSTSQYITSRRCVNFFPSGSNVYNANSGNKNIRFNISADDNNYIDCRLLGCLPPYKILMPTVLSSYDPLVI